MSASHQNIKERKFSFCPRLSAFSFDHLIVQCPDCTNFLAACCQHESFGGDWCEPDQPTCHQFQLVFTDGACSNNGRDTAKAGLGIVIDVDEYFWSIPVDDTLDAAPRTNQRAELLAAIEGLKKLNLMHQSCSDGENEIDHSTSGARRRATANNDYRATFIVVTDSEYVVKGITEWFPDWRIRGWRKADGKRPVNLDLFMKLDEYTTTLERDRVQVGFWRVPRAYNHRADRLAKEATRV